MKCLICKTENAAKNFERGKTPSNLTLFRLSVGKIDDALVADARLMDRGCAAHAWTTDRAFFDRVAELRSMADTKQDVQGFIHTGGR